MHILSGIGAKGFKLLSKKCPTKASLPIMPMTGLEASQ
jgi:hypothetical protein